MADAVLAEDDLGSCLYALPVLACQKEPRAEQFRKVFHLPVPAPYQRLY